jgi:hypothetical protein
MKVTTSSSSGTIVNNSGWAATSTNTAYNPNIGNTFIYQTTPTPFNIRFNWDDKEVDISLKDGNDIFKLANKFMEWMDMNEIEYNVKTKGKRKK